MAVAASTSPSVSTSLTVATAPGGTAMRSRKKTVPVTVRTCSEAMS
jgi:hypothetical protein